MSIFDWHTQKVNLLNAVDKSQVDELDTDGESDVSSLLCSNPVRCRCV